MKDWKEKLANVHENILSKINSICLIFLLSLVIGSDYNDLMTNNPYHTFDPNRASYGFQPSMLIDSLFFSWNYLLIFTL